MFGAIRYKVLCALMVLFLLPVCASARSDINWGAVKASPVTLFYPGTTSYEFLTSDDHRLGARNILKVKKNCHRCHLSKNNELDLKADEIVSGKARKKRSQEYFETEPIPGKKGVLIAYLQAVYDNDFIYIKITWDSIGFGWHSTDRVADRVSMQINKKNDSFSRYGCFITCHGDVNTMPATPSKEEVRAHPYYKEAVRDDVRLYAYYTREGAGWDNIKGPEVLKGLRDSGGLIDLWSVKLSGGVATAQDGWVLEDRRWETGSDISTETRWVGGGGKGRYGVVFKRKLRTGEPEDIQLEAGDTFTVALSIHDDGTEKRKHYVSFPMLIGLGADAEVRAKKLLRKL